MWEELDAIVVSVLPVVGLYWPGSPGLAALVREGKASLPEVVSSENTLNLEDCHTFKKIFLFFNLPGIVSPLFGNNFGTYRCKWTVGFSAGTVMGQGSVKSSDVAARVCSLPGSALAP